MIGTSGSLPFSLLLNVFINVHIGESASLTSVLGAQKALEENKSLPVTVKNVSETRRLMPQFMLEVKAMARPLIPPGKISLSTSQGTRRKARVGGVWQNDQAPIDTEGQPTDLSVLVLHTLCLESRATSLLAGGRRDVLPPYL